MCALLLFLHYTKKESQRGPKDHLLSKLANSWMNMIFGNHEWIKFSIRGNKVPLLGDHQRCNICQYFFSPSSVQIQISYNSDDFKIWTKLTLTVVKLIAEGTRRQMFQNVDENKLIQTSQTAPSIHIMIELCYFSLVQCTMTFPIKEN